MTRALVLWSGGVESTSALLWLLQNTDHDIVAAHISMQNPENRHQEEADAIAALTPYLQEVRKFRLSVSFLNLDGARCLPLDYEVLLPLAIPLKHHFQADFIVRGQCLEDAETRKIGREATPKEVFEDKNSCVVGMLPNYRNEIPWLNIFALPKKQHMDYLGTLLPLTWSCRRPKAEGVPCGTCHSCKQRNHHVH